jgi:glutamate dehydrogenase
VATAAQRPASPHADRFFDLLPHGASPGELDGFEPVRAAAAAFVAETAAQRRPGEPAIRIDRHAETGPGARRMAVAIINDDMPFLVDSTALAVAAAGLESRRLLHPVVDVRRDAEGRLTEIIGPAGGARPDGTLRESVIYMELDRATAATRARLAEDLQRTLADVRLAVADWKPMLERVHAAARRLADLPPPLPPHQVAEDVAFLEWLAADNFTFLGWRGLMLDPATGRLVSDGEGLGLLRDPATRAWDGGGEDDLPEPLERFLARADAITISTADLVARVHRRTACDYVSVKRYDGQGRPVGEDRFLGLFTSGALSQTPRQVPRIRRKVNRVIEELGFDPRGHNGKALIHVLESMPREELFQVEPERLREMALGLLSLIDRPRPRLFIRADPFGRLVSALVYLPRDQYSGEMRASIGRMLEAAVGSGLDHYDVELRSEGLARIHYVFGLGGGFTPEFDEAALNERLVELVRGWDEALEVELTRRLGVQRAARLTLSPGKLFSTSYRAQFSAAEAAEDLERMLSLDAPGAHDVKLYRKAEDAPGQMRLKIYHLERVIPLSDAVPVLERFGFRVIEEYPFDIDAGLRGYIHDFLLELADPAKCQVALLESNVAPALKAVLNGQQENDIFNALVLAADLDGFGVGLIRALYRYLRQTGFAYAQQTVVDALRAHCALTADLVALFRARFDPDHRGEAAEAIRARIGEALDSVTSIDEDRVARALLSVIEATLRTNAFAPAAADALAFKIDSSKVPGLPAPIPYREIWVYSPRVEGIHLRGGPVARGGLRWSDRREDFRTEILGLLKAQLVKNAVIVPTGAKGGFYPKKLPPASEREAWLAEGTECYRIFIRSLLSVTDNIVGDEVVPPERVVRHDGDDPYLVVAADKGTATFSDVANAIALERDFWLGDAFASGGSVGYDHKAMGITAKGAWVAVTRHFAEMGVDVQRDPVSVVGVGDMSGDVFGNGMLLSKAIRLVAAFDHRHIFLDPAPDPEASWAERKRLFDLPRSSWADYDAKRISKGGGVFARTQKVIPLSPEVRAALGVEAEEMGPSDLIRAVLRAPADLLWLGGIGTYVKAASESHADVGDRANDANRVDAEELRVQVVGEGANLGVTQAGRVAFALAGGRVNTDFIDNSAGVDTSDHEVNIKIAMQPAVRSGQLSAEERVELLADMQDEVAELVLEDNRLQTLALSLAERRGVKAMPAFQHVMRTLEEQGRLDRSVEGLPGDDLIAQRLQVGRGLTRPELSVLLAHAKLAIQDALEKGRCVDCPSLEADLIAGFPSQLSQRLPEALPRHRLRREILATTIANEMVNRGGIAFAFDLSEEMGATPDAVAAAFIATRELFDLKGLWLEIDSLPAGGLQNRLHEEVRFGTRAHVSDVLRTWPGEVQPGPIVEAARPGVERVADKLADLLRTEVRARLDALSASLAAEGAPPDIAQRIVRLVALDGAIAIARLARDLGADEVRLAQAYTELGQALGLDWAKGRAAAYAPSDPWERLLVASAERDFEQVRFDLIGRISAKGADPVEATHDWLRRNPGRSQRVVATVSRARQSAGVTAAMLAHLAAQARAALSA